LLRAGAPSDPKADSTPIVFIIDADASVRESLTELARFSGWRAEGFGTAGEFLQRPHAMVPSCVVLEVRLPDLSGLDLQRRMVAERREMPIVFLTSYGDIPITVQAMKAGAIEFFMKPLNEERMLSTMGRAMEASRAKLEQETELLALHERHSSLSTREQEVMALVVTGLLNKQVAFELGISEITVKAHRGNVMRKMKATSIVDLIMMATRLDFFSNSRNNLLLI
jgi:FixJ family two-component response regulator